MTMCNMAMPISGGGIVPSTTSTGGIDPATTSSLTAVLGQLTSALSSLAGVLAAMNGSAQLANPAAASPAPESAPPTPSGADAAPASQPAPPAATTGGGSSTAAASHAKAGVLLIGDSLTVGTKKFMATKVGDAPVTIDATGGIPLKEGMRRYDAVKDKPRVVEMALFTNNTPNQIGELRSAIEKTVKDARERGGKVVWATIHGVQKWGSYDAVNSMIRDLASKNSDVMGLVDWEKMVQANPSYLAGDKIHGTTAGYKARAAAFEQAAR
jgi:hypothetical protein